MRARVLHLWESLTSGYWFVPSVIVCGAAVMALSLLQIDRHLIGGHERTTWLYGGGSDGARALLSTVASSVITVAGVVFSITIAALTQASSQFGPRLLRNFMRDTGNQVVLGVFVATFVYCLLVLRTIHGKLEDGEAFVPQASVTVAVLLAAASIAVLIYFIHHVSMSLQAPIVVATARADLERVIKRLPQNHDENFADPVEPKTDGALVPATVEGYVQVIDYDRLMELAIERDVVLQLHYRPGDFIIDCAELAHVHPAERCDDELTGAINGSFICGRQSTSEQDIEYAIRQMVEVGVRALSPGVNDPRTAINCIDGLGAAICHVARRQLPARHCRDQSGALRLIRPVATFESVVDASFNEIRQHGRTNVAVTIRLLEIMETCLRQLTDEAHRAPLLRQARLVYRQSQDALADESDRRDAQARWDAIDRK